MPTSLSRWTPAEWERRPGGESRPVQAPREVPSLVGESTIEAARANLTAWQAMVLDPELTVSEMIKARAGLNSALRTVADLEAKADATESRIVLDHPVWRAIVRGLADVLRPYPDAAEAVAAFLGELGGES